MNDKPLISTDIQEIQIENKNYEILKLIGSGSFGKIYAAKFEKNVYAIKRIQLCNNFTNIYSLVIELGFVQKITARLDEILPLVKIYDYEFKDNCLYYVMEVGKCSLEDFFQSNLIGKDDRMYHIWIIYSYILKALLFLESIKVVHRDIKPHNFLIFDDKSKEWGFNVKLIDFGTIRVLDQNFFTKTNNIYGSLAFMAPETLKYIVSLKSDIWSLGIILFYMIFDGVFPDYVKTEESIRKFASNEEEVKFPSCLGIFSHLLQITKKCLIKNVEKRLCASELFEYTYKKHNLNVFNRIIIDLYIKMTESDEFLTEYENEKKTNIKHKRNFKCPQTMYGHQNSVWCLQKIDENTLVSGSDDYSIKIWNLKNFDCVQTMIGHTSSVWCLEIINKNTLASGSRDNSIKIWDLKNYNCIHTMKGHSNSVLCLQLIDQNTLASGSRDKSIRIWNLRNYNCLKTIYGHSFSVWCLQLIGKNKLASNSLDNTIKIWNLQNYDCLQTMYGHSNSVRCIQLIDENRLASGGDDNSIKIWDLKNYICVQTMNGHAGCVWSIQIINKNTLVSGSRDNSIKIWNLENYNCVQTLNGHIDSVLSLQLMNENKLASGSSDNSIKIWNLQIQN